MTMRKIQTQGVHHITIDGANRQTSIDFWEGVLGIDRVHLADAIERLVTRSQAPLSDDRSPKNPY
jgi:hypothetical protein